MAVPPFGSSRVALAARDRADGVTSCGFTARSDRLRVTACADPAKEAALGVAALAGQAEAFASVGELLARGEVDAVIIATPHHLLCETALTAIQAGKHVLAVGTALECIYGERAHEIEAVAPQLARHFEAAGVAKRAVEYLYQAGRRAQRLYANSEAVEYFRRALGLLTDAPLEGIPKGWRQERAAQIRESLGDVLEWTDDHEQARIAYEEALTQVSGEDPIWQSHLCRKVGNIWRMQSRYERALRSYDLTGAALGEGTLESTPAWWEEWVQIRLERMWMHYWLGQWRAISELADQVQPVVEQRGSPAQCISFFVCLASMKNRRDRYVVSEDTLALCRTAVAISQEMEDRSQIAWARFLFGFSQLWFGDLDAAEQQMQAALALTEDTSDVVDQLRCLTYLTILSRKRGQVRQARQYAVRSLAAAKAGKMVEYTGMTRANRPSNASPMSWLRLCKGLSWPVRERPGKTCVPIWDKRWSWPRTWATSRLGSR